jgi:hypothetical protein
MRGFVLVSLFVGLLICAPVYAGALDERAPVSVQVSAREAFAVDLLFDQLGRFQGDDQKAERRVAEALDFAAIDTRVDQIRRVEKRSPEFADFSDAPVKRMVPKDDLARIPQWIKAMAVPGNFLKIVDPLLERIHKIVGAG